MPVSAQEHRVRTGLYSSCKGAWLSHHKLKHFSPTTKIRSSKEETECDTTYLQLMWFLATVILLVPLMYTTTMIATTILEVLLQINISTNGGADMVHDISHQAKLDLSWVIDIFHLVREIFSWLVQHRRIITLLSLFCVLIISTVTAVICLSRCKSKQSVHNVVIAQIGSKIVIVQSEVQKVSMSPSCQRLMGVSLVVAILTAIIISLMLIKSGDVELNPGPTKRSKQPSDQLQDQPSCSNSAGPSTLDPVRLLPKDLHEVYETVLPTVCPKWYNFGLALGLSPATLKTIEHDNPKESETCLREAIYKRLCKEPFLTWNDIVRALRQTSVAENGLAIEIMRKYHLVGPDEDITTLLDQMRSALSGEPTLEELCSLPVERVWYSLGLWLGMEECKLRQIKEQSANKTKQLFEVFVSFPMGTKRYEEFFSSLCPELKKMTEEVFDKSGPSRTHLKEQLISQLSEKQREHLEHLLSQRNYEQLVIALVKMGSRMIAEKICDDKGVSLTAYLDATDPDSNRPGCVVKYANYLKSKYKHKPFLVNPDWPPSVSKGSYFTNLSLIESAEQRKTEESNEMAYDYAYGNIDDIVARKEAISLEEAFLPIIDQSSLRSRLAILMDGAPGVGKTTITRKICIEWANDRLLCAYNLVILVRLREVNRNDKLTIEDLLSCDDPELKQDIVSSLQKSSGANVLFILDGFDELDSTKLSIHSFILDLIQGKKFHRCSILVTSRPYASECVRRCVNRHIEVAGFTKEQIKEYFQHSLPKEQADKLVLRLEERPDISSICYIPLNCSIVAYVFTHQEYELPSTLTQLYEFFILHTIKHHADRIDPDPNVWCTIKKCHNIKKLPMPVLQKLDCLSKVAFSGIQNNRLIFDEEDYLSNSLSLGLMTSLESFAVTGTIEHFQFLHLTIQEFLAARHIQDNGDDFMREFVKKNLLEERFRMTLLFLAGLTKLEFMKADVPLMQIIPSINVAKHQSLLAHLSYECGEVDPKCKIFFLCCDNFKLPLNSTFNTLVNAHLLSVQPADHVWKLIVLDDYFGSGHLEILLRKTRESELPGILRSKVINLSGCTYTPNSELILPILSAKSLHLTRVHLPMLYNNSKPNNCKYMLEFSNLLAKNETLQTVTIGSRHEQVVSLNSQHVFSKRSLVVSPKLGMGFPQQVKLCPKTLKTLCQFMDPISVKEISIPNLSTAFKDCIPCDTAGNVAEDTLLDLIDNSPVLQTLDISGCDLSNEAIARISSALVKKTNLVSVNIGEHEITKQDLGNLLTVLFVPAKLTIMNVTLELDRDFILHISHVSHINNYTTISQKYFELLTKELLRKSFPHIVGMQSIFPEFSYRDKDVYFRLVQDFYEAYPFEELRVCKTPGPCVEQIVQGLINNLRTKSQLKTLKVECKMSSESAYKLIEATRENRTLETLSIKFFGSLGEDIPDSENLFGNVLSKNCTLKVLELYGDIRLAIGSLAKGLMQNSSLEELHFEAVFLCTSEKWLQFFLDLESSSIFLKRLSMSDSSHCCHTASQWYNALSRMLSQNTTIAVEMNTVRCKNYCMQSEQSHNSSRNYESSQDSDICWAKIFQSLPKVSLQCLTITDNKLGDEGFVALTDFLSSNNKLTTLQAKSLQASDQNFLQFSQELSNNHTLTEITVIHNRLVTDVGWKAFFEALQCSDTVVKLDISYNCIGAVGLSALTEYIRHSQTISSLRAIQCDNIKYEPENKSAFVEHWQQTNRRWMNLLEFVQDSSSIKSLTIMKHPPKSFFCYGGPFNLWVCTPKNNFGITIANLILKNRKIQKLSLLIDFFPDDVSLFHAMFRAIAESLMKNSSLQELEVSSDVKRWITDHLDLLTEEGSTFPPQWNLKITAIDWSRNEIKL